MKRKRVCKPTTTDKITGEVIKLPDDRTLWINSLRESGHTIAETAKIVGIAESSVTLEHKLYRDTVARGAGGVENWQKDADVILPLAFRALVNKLKSGDGRLAAEVLRGRGILVNSEHQVTVSTANPAEQLIEGLATLLQVPEYRRQIVAMIADTDTIPVIPEHTDTTDKPVSEPTEPPIPADTSTTQRRDKESQLQDTSQPQWIEIEEEGDDDIPIGEGKHAFPPDPPHTPESAGTSDIGDGSHLKPREPETLSGKVENFSADLESHDKESSDGRV